MSTTGPVDYDAIVPGAYVTFNLVPGGLKVEGEIVHVLRTTRSQWYEVRIAGIPGTAIVNPGQITRVRYPAEASEDE